ncbi:tafazzin, conserved protein [Histoplasma capsulatum var. duboisii H88]|uniref:Tafazzin, conserved protein n=1 Tax=Ajellomyces capsulatus (strain H88) TaxID=544711 RepID=A0A8A1LVJ5_AJEC8|nr:tafazzin, conserved protein [Histoplasma capsulatum var. duboisii H88]
MVFLAKPPLPPVHDNSFVPRILANPNRNPKLSHSECGTSKVQFPLLCLRRDRHVFRLRKQLGRSRWCSPQVL